MVDGRGVGRDEERIDARGRSRHGLDGKVERLAGARVIVAGTNPVMVDDTARTLRELGAEVAVAGANLDLDRLKTLDPHVVVHHQSAFSRTAVARAVARIPRMRGALRVAIQGVPHWPRAFEPLIDTVEIELTRDRALARRLAEGGEIDLEEAGSARLLRAAMELGVLLRISLRVQMMRIEVELEGDLVLGARVVDDDGGHYLDGRAALALAMSLDRGSASAVKLSHPTFVSIVAPLTVALEDQRVSEPPNESWSMVPRRTLEKIPRRRRVASEPPSDLVIAVGSPEPESPQVRMEADPAGDGDGSMTPRSRDGDPLDPPLPEPAPEEQVIELAAPTEPLEVVPPRKEERVLELAEPRRPIDVPPRTDETRPLLDDHTRKLGLRPSRATAPTLSMPNLSARSPSGWPVRAMGLLTMAAIAAMGVYLFRAPVTGERTEEAAPPPPVAAPSHANTDEPDERDPIDESRPSSETTPLDVAPVSVGPQPPQVSSAPAVEPFLPQRITRHHDRASSDALLAEALEASGAERFSLLRAAAEAHQGNPHVAEAIAREALDLGELAMAEAWARRAVQVRRRRPAYRALLAEIRALRQTAD